MAVSDWLNDRGLPGAITEELILLLPDEMPEAAMAWF